MGTVERIQAAAAELLAALDAFTSIDPAELGGVAVALVGVSDRLSARHAVVSRRAELAGSHELGEATSMTAWLTHRADTARSRCATLITTGRFLTDHPVLVVAALDGELSAAHVTPIRSAATTVACREPLTEPGTQTDMITWAGRHPFADWERVLGHWATVVDPDGTEDAAARAHENRRFALHPTFADAGYVGEVCL